MPKVRARRQLQQFRWRLVATVVAVLFLLTAAFIAGAARIGIPGARAIAEAPTVVFDVVVLALMGAAWSATRSRFVRRTTAPSSPKQRERLG